MEMKDIEVVLEEALAKPEDDVLRTKYTDEIVEFLKTHKSSDELVTIVVKGIDIDRAANYYDYLEEISKNDVQSIWKQIRENKEILANKDNKGLKFVSGLLGLSFMKVGNMAGQTGNIITKLLSMVMDEKKPIPSEVYTPIIMDYYMNDVLAVINYPKWETFKLSGEMNKKFAELLIQITSGEQDDKYKNIRQWATNGLLLAEGQIEEEKIQAKIPKSMIADMQTIIEHYKSVEKQLRDGVYEAAKLEHTIEGLQYEISKLNMDKRELETKIKDLHTDVNTHKKRVKEREKEIEERKKINDAADALKKHDEEGMLKDIANELKAEYKDFVDSENDEMDVQLGEIYREKLKNIFKILAKKGIRME